MKKVIIYSIIVLVVAGGLYAYREFTRKPKHAGELEADFKLHANELVNEFSDEDAATKKYNTKVIEIRGTVGSVEKNRKCYDLLIETDDPMTGVNVHLIEEENNKAESLQPGQEVTVCGICTGMLSDIELNKGVIKKHK